MIVLQTWIYRTQAKKFTGHNKMRLGIWPSELISNSDQYSKRSIEVKFKCAKATKAVWLVANAHLYKYSCICNQHKCCARVLFAHVPRSPLHLYQKLIYFYFCKYKETSKWNFVWKLVFVYISWEIKNSWQFYDLQNIK